jgi:two-component system chemotaxis sensor kinase CheA
MSIDNEILQDFLVEAGELFDQLNDQFAELEKSPEDIDIINAIFRAYHTIKGGAGFMKLMPMVEVCHRAEDAINQLRQGERQVTDELIDVMFQTLDELEDMFNCVRAGDELDDANAELLEQLDALLSQNVTQGVAQEDEKKVGEDITKADITDTELNEITEQSMDDEFEAMLANSNNEITNEPDSGIADGLITDDEFDAVLDQLHGKGKHGKGRQKVITKNTQTQTDSDLINDDEFDAVLDNLHGKGRHGKGKHGCVAETDKKTVDKPAIDQQAVASDLITDDEFEAALDQLHGKGKGPRIISDNNVSTLPIEAESMETNEAKQESTTHKKPKAEKPKEKKVKDKSANKPQADSTIRVDTARLDDIMNLVGELVLVRNRLTTLKHETKNASLSDAISTLELVSSELQSSVMKTRMQPIKKVFSRFPRVIRDLARKLKKDINLELIGEETDLDKSLVEALADPLIHLVRNAADHGIESPQDRFESGKSRQGKVTLSAKQEGDQILLTVSDDGKGMDHNVLRKKAVEKGMMSEDAASSLSDKEAYNLIFAAGFSTATEVSDVSGRGVGMDVVKTRINELNGNVEIDSVLGEGSVISIYLPLTLAILPTLMIRLNQYQFALPLSNVLEAFNMKPDQINVIDGHEVIRVRDKPLPLFYLSPWLVQGTHFSGPEASQKVIVVQMGNRRFCLVVDHIAGQEEVVIKPLGKMLNNTRGFSGATITGDGSIALIIDVPSLLTAYAANSTVY